MALIYKETDPDGDTIEIISRSDGGLLIRVNDEEMVLSVTQQEEMIDSL